MIDMKRSRTQSNTMSATVVLPRRQATRSFLRTLVEMPLRWV